LMLSQKLWQTATFLPAAVYIQGKQFHPSTRNTQQAPHGMTK